MYPNPVTTQSPRHLAVGVAVVGVAAVVLGALPAEVLAAAGDAGGSGGGASKAAKAFQDNGIDSARAVGIVIFSVVAIFAIARGTFGGKAGQGLVAFAVACLGMSVTLEPEAVMSGIGGWVTGLFKG